MNITLSIDEELGCDSFGNADTADDFMVINSSMMNSLDIDDFNTDELFINFDSQETSCFSGASASLTRYRTSAFKKVNCISNGSNDDDDDDDTYFVEEEDLAKPFPLLLHTIVSSEATDKAIHWLPCGKRFVVSDKEEFTQNILPRYFCGRGTGPTAKTKFTSFTRRLKRWNFSRVPAGRELGAYYHEYFQRGQPELAKKISYPMSKQASSTARRRKSTDSGLRLTSRRASTGTMPLPLMPELDISPSPLKKSKVVHEDSTEEMKMWLSNTEFELEGNSFPSTMKGNMELKQNFITHTRAVASSDTASLCHPTTLSGTIVESCWSLRRRHSYVNHLPIQHIGNHWYDAPKFDLGMNTPLTPKAAVIPMSSQDSLDVYSPNDVFSSGETGTGKIESLVQLNKSIVSIDDDEEFTSNFTRDMEIETTVTSHSV